MKENVSLFYDQMKNNIKITYYTGILRSSYLVVEKEVLE